MDTLYTARLHGFPPNISHSSIETNISEESVLSLLIVLGSSVSLVALVFAFITYSLFSDLRNLSGTTLLNLISTLFMTQLLYVIGVGSVLDSQLCIALASALHYIRLSVLCWMLLMAHNLFSQYKTGLYLNPVTDTHIKRNFIRYSIFGWGFPAVTLSMTILIQYHDKGGRLLDTEDLKGQNCWFLSDHALIYGLVIPSCLLICATLYYLLRSAIFSRYVVSMQPDKRIRDKMQRKGTLQLILFTKITLVLFISLVLATLSKLFKSEGIWISFHVVQGLQGILIAMLVTCNCQVLKLYMRSLKSKATLHVPSYVGQGKSSGLSKSTSLQLLTWDPPPDLV
ncbi:adhesion G protein-coupled receptor E3-like [Sitophilus oryzae]|uniref:Adhesion G protein-coupled receptor E3-like n=1 Tax=Sitophilus oryzae TaxID=7048 RepID=A0A6J2X9B7_SITOR|nr:adhesion G protein-coupled receptor E3-like [Sitophilus oryzae]